MNLPSLPPQAIAIYRLLLAGKVLSAREIGKSLGIFPHGAYRAIKVLMLLGCVEKVGKLPIRFKAKSVSESLDIYLLVHRQWFEKNFSGYEKREEEKRESKKVLDIVFIQDRQSLMERSTRDLEYVNEEVCLLISGHEAPAETMLQHKRALERGVTVKILVQHFTPKNMEMLWNWQRMGIQVRLGPTTGARVFIFDSRVVYIASYNLKQESEAIGVRFNYGPIARLMRGVFIKQWGMAKELNF